MKTKIIKEVLVNFEKDDRESIKKVITLINELINVGINNNCDCYEISTIYRDQKELEGLIQFLKDLAYSEVIELT